ncbi:MAG: hypothetical protein HKN85_13250 [Gammaproteobacteria bacterium]|nr:hypothetical protein [Gammaproteobacteria bacterium]
MIGLGLLERGEADWAERISGDTKRLIEKSGFYEYFSPLTGEGLGGDYFSWTAAIDLFWPTVTADT